MFLLLLTLNNALGRTENGELQIVAGLGVLRWAVYGPYGLDTLLSSSGFFSVTEHAAAVWRKLPGLAQWATTTLIWLGAGLAALWAAASRHGERRRQLMLNLHDVTHVYPNGTRALDHVTLVHPARHVRPAGAERRRQVDADAHGRDAADADAGAIRFGDIDVIAEPETTAPHARLPAAGFRRLSARLGLRHARPHGGAEGHRLGRPSARTTVETLLQQMNLWDVRKKALAGFSGGMRQRFGIAQALIGNPELIIVDEPTAGLDPEERNRFLNLLAEIGENVVVILSTHIVEDVSDLCPRMAVLADGRVQLEGRAARADRQHARQGLEEDDRPRRARRSIASGTRSSPPASSPGSTMIHVLSDARSGRRLRAGRGRPRGRLLLHARARSRRAA